MTFGMAAMRCQQPLSTVRYHRFPSSGHRLLPEPSLYMGHGRLYLLGCAYAEAETGT
jgi:hypothetical protein